MAPAPVDQTPAQASVGVCLDPLADLEGPTSIEGGPTDVDPGGLPVGSVVPEGAPEGAMGPMILFMSSR